MKITRATSILVLLTFIQSCFPLQLIAAEQTTSPSSTSSLMPENRVSKTLNGADSGILIQELMVQNPPAVSPIQKIHFVIDPDSGGAYDLEINTAKGTAYLFMGSFTAKGVYNAASSTASITLYDFPTLKMKANFTFGTKDGAMFVKAFTADVNYSGRNITQSSAYASDGSVLSMARSFTENGVMQQASFYVSDSGRFSASFTVSDSLKKQTTIHASQLDASQYKALLAKGFELAELEKAIVSLASQKISFTWSDGLEFIQSTKENGVWVPKIRSVYRNNNTNTYILGGANDVLIVQNQALDGFPDYAVRYGYIRAEDPFSGFGLAFSAPGKDDVIVDYPRTKSLKLNGVEYLIEIDPAGKLKLKLAEEYPGQHQDVNHDRVLDDNDVDLMKAAIGGQVYDADFDLNRDGKVNGDDMKVLTDRYVKILQATSHVIFVDASKGETIAAAQAMVRVLIANGMTKPVNVLIMEGTYYDTNLQFDARDSGRNGFYVTYRGYPGKAMPELVGGKLIDSAKWVAAPEVGAGVYRVSIVRPDGSFADPQTLFVNGVAVKNADSVSEGWQEIVGAPESNNLLSIYPDAVVKAESAWADGWLLSRTYLANNGGLAREEKYPLKVTYEKNAANVITATLVAVYSADGTTQIRTDRYAENKTLAQVIAQYKAGMKPMQISSYNQVVLKPGALPANFDPAKVIANFWTDPFFLNRVGVKSYDPATGILTLDTALYTPLRADRVNGTYQTQNLSGFRISLSNSKSFLSENEYLSDGRGNLYFKPIAGQNIRNLKIVLPENDQVLKVEGTIENPVHHIVFSDLDIQGGDGLDRYSMSHADLTKFDVNPKIAAVLLNNTKYVSVIRSTIHDTGAAGISLVGVSEEVEIAYNKLTRIGSDGIIINGDDPLVVKPYLGYRPRLLSQKNTVRYNEISYTGEVFEKSDGIHLVQTASNDISYNRLHDIAYNGIYMTGMQDYTMGTRTNGYKWGDGYHTPGYDERYDWNYLRNNVISYNDISSVLLYTNDGGAIYTHSSGKDNEISHNTIHDIVKSPAPFTVMWTYGIYLDGGQSDYFTIKNNLVKVSDPHTVAVTINGSHNLFENNTIVSNQPMHLLQLLSGGAPTDNTVRNNVFFNSNVKAFNLILYSMYEAKRWYPPYPGAPKPSNVYNSKNKATDPDEYWIVTPNTVLAASENNVFYTAAGHNSTYGVITTWMGWIGDFVNGQWTPVIYRVPVAKWQKEPGPGYTSGFDLNSTFSTLPIFVNAANNDYRLVSNPLKAGIE